MNSHQPTIRRNVEKFLAQDHHENFLQKVIFAHIGRKMDFLKNDPISSNKGLNVDSSLSWWRTCVSWWYFTSDMKKSKIFAPSRETFFCPAPPESVTLINFNQFSFYRIIFHHDTSHIKTKPSSLGQLIASYEENQWNFWPILSAHWKTWQKISFLSFESLFLWYHRAVMSLASFYWDLRNPKLF